MYGDKVEDANNFVEKLLKTVLPQESYLIENCTISIFKFFLPL